MSQQSPRKLSYANVVATSALVLAVAGGGGAAVAAGLAANSVGSPQIKNGAVKTVDLGNNTVKGAKVADGSLTGADLANGSVTGGKVADNSLTGADINEATLALPPSVKIAESTITSGTLSSSLTPVSTLSFTAPAAGYVYVTASASYRANSANTFILGQLVQDSTVIRSQWQDAGDVDGWYDNSQTIVAAAPVSAGSHTYTFRGYESTPAAFSNYTDAQLVVQFVPTGSATVSPRAVLPRQ